ncbi:hypothetical protein ACFL1X_09060 [Candidatus Hydrogenedentota bacterium]
MKNRLLFLLKFCLFVPIQIPVFFFVLKPYLVALSAVAVFAISHIAGYEPETAECVRKNTPISFLAPYNLQYTYQTRTFGINGTRVTINLVSYYALVLATAGVAMRHRLARAARGTFVLVCLHLILVATAIVAGISFDGYVLQQIESLLFVLGISSTFLLWAFEFGKELGLDEFFQQHEHKEPKETTSQ